MSITHEQKALVALAQIDAAAQQAAAQRWSYSHFLGYLLEAALQERSLGCSQSFIKAFYI